MVLEKETEGGECIATGVRFVHRNHEYMVPVNGEIIISAGSLQSPQILELSGIGNPNVLKAAGIDIKIANPNVGENLQDHMSRGMATYITSPANRNSDGDGVRA